MAGPSASPVVPAAVAPAVDVGGRVVGGGRVVVGVAAGAGRPHPGPAGDQGQGERGTGNAEPGRGGAGPDAPGVQHEGDQRAGQAGRDQGDPDPREQVAWVGQGEHALAGGQPGIAGVEHGVPDQPGHQQDQPSGADQHHAQEAGWPARPGVRSWASAGRRRRWRPIGWVMSSMGARLQTSAAVGRDQLCPTQVSRW